MRMMAAAAALAAGAAAAQDDPAFGRWLTENGKAAVEIAPCGAQACGRIVWLADPLGPTGQPLRDRRNPDPALRDRTVCGMALLGGFTREGPGRWTGGEIYSAENGKTYSANMTVEDGRLRLRGYVGLPMFGETQVWTRDVGAGGC
jgi:uncharacterized protein (DUF2147 family)